MSDYNTNNTRNINSSQDNYDGIDEGIVKINNIRTRQYKKCDLNSMAYDLNRKNSNLVSQNGKDASNEEEYLNFDINQERKIYTTNNKKGQISQLENENVIDDNPDTDTVKDELEDGNNINEINEILQATREEENGLGITEGDSIKVMNFDKSVKKCNLLEVENRIERNRMKEHKKQLTESFKAKIKERKKEVEEISNKLKKENTIGSINLNKIKGKLTKKDLKLLKWICEEKIVIDSCQGSSGDKDNIVWGSKDVAEYGVKLPTITVGWVDELDYTFFDNICYAVKYALNNMFQCCGQKNR